MKMANYRKWQTRQTTALWTSLGVGTYRILSLILSLNIRWLRTIQFDFNTLKTFQLGTYQFVTSCIQTFYLAMCWITTISVNICRKNGYFTRSHKDIMPKDANREFGPIYLNKWRPWLPVCEAVAEATDMLFLKQPAGSSHWYWENMWFSSRNIHLFC